MSRLVFIREDKRRLEKRREVKGKEVKGEGKRSEKRREIMKVRFVGGHSRT